MIKRPIYSRFRRQQPQAGGHSRTQQQAARRSNFTVCKQYMQILYKKLHSGYIDFLTPTKITPHYNHNGESTHPKTAFIVAAKASLPCFCLFSFKWNCLSQTSRLRPPPDTHTHSVNNQTNPADMFFHSHAHIHTYYINFSPRTFLYFWTSGLFRRQHIKALKKSKILNTIVNMYINVYLIQTCFLLIVSSRCSFINLCCICGHDIRI